MTGRPDWTPREQRTIDGQRAAIAAVQIAQGVCIGYGAWQAVKSDYWGLAIALLVAASMRAFLPRVDPALAVRATELDKAEQAAVDRARRRLNGIAAKHKARITADPLAARVKR